MNRKNLKPADRTAESHAIIAALRGKEGLAPPRPPALVARAYQVAAARS